MAYISREKAIEIIKSGGYWEQEDMEVAIACIEQTPTADVVEVKRGKWLNIVSTQRYRCSLCGNEIYFGKDKFCSECGAKMDGTSKGIGGGEVNILEHYIKEIHSIKEFEKYPDMIEVDVACNCYGSIQRVKYLTDKKQWQIDLEKGYFMA